LEIACRTPFGTGACPEPESVGGWMHDALRATAPRFNRPFPVPEWVPLPSHVQPRRAVQPRDAVAMGMIARCRARTPGAAGAPGDVLGREAIVDCVVGGVPVPKGTSVFMSQWVVHHDGRFFPNPDAFEPGRWTEGFERSLPRFAYFPFGGGPRACIGQSFAMT